jgi:hypothetical protein
MSGAIISLPQYAFMAWCSVKRKAQAQLYLYLSASESITATSLFHFIISKYISSTFYRHNFIYTHTHTHTHTHTQNEA